ncbi:hypothetical protein L1887_36815 [Cichorium endivia]|nr:hypothetical protein L1887_36815 [Cichorium endivia]
MYQVLDMEYQVLEVLSFHLRFILVAQSSCKVPSVELGYLANYLAGLTLIEFGFLKFLPSVVVASSCNPTLEHYTNYNASDLKATVLALQDMQLNSSPRLLAIRQKLERTDCSGSWRIKFEVTSANGPKENVIPISCKPTAVHMKAFSLFGPSDTIRLFGAASSSVSSRTQLSFPQRLFFCQAKTDASVSLVNVPPNLLLAEREEAKAVLLTHYAGREVTTPEIRDALIPYLDEFVEEHGDNFVEVLEYFPIPLVKDEIAQKPPVDVLETSTTKSEETVQKATSQVTNNTETPNLPLHVVYLEELGMELEAIKEVIRKFPAFAYYSLEGNMKPVVEFLLDLGISKSDIYP